MSGDIRSVSISRDLVGSDTTSREPNRRLIEYICDYLKRFGIEPVLIWNDERTKAYLLATIGPPDVPGIILRRGEPGLGSCSEAVAAARKSEVSRVFRALPSAA